MPSKSGIDLRGLAARNLVGKLDNLGGELEGLLALSASVWRWMDGWMGSYPCRDLRFVIPGASQSRLRGSRQLGFHSGGKERERDRRRERG